MPVRSLIILRFTYTLYKLLCSNPRRLPEVAGSFNSSTEADETQTHSSKKIESKLKHQMKHLNFFLKKSKMLTIMISTGSQFFYALPTALLLLLRFLCRSLATYFHPRWLGRRAQRYLKSKKDTIEKCINSSKRNTMGNVFWNTSRNKS